MDCEFLAGVQRHLVDLAAADQGDETTPCELGVTPVGETLRLLALASCFLAEEEGGREGGTILWEIVGLEEMEWPVHARRASCWVSIQSTFPSSSMTPKVVFGVFVDIRQVRGEVDDI